MRRIFSCFLLGRNHVNDLLGLLLGLLVLLNVSALWIYVAPPGGSRRELIERRAKLMAQLAERQHRVAEMNALSSRIIGGNSQKIAFADRFFLPRRQAYAALVSELQRLSNAAGLQDRDAVYNEEPIEGAEGLALLSSTANYEGEYANLLHFLQAVDRSDLLLMLDSLQASPQEQKGNRIRASIRFQVVIHDDGSPAIETL